MNNRLLSSSARACNLVGPSHPLSNLRPVIYDDALPKPSPKPGHPYSLSEFRGVRDYQWKLQRQQLDSFNHVFWAESNARFESAKTTALNSLPKDASQRSRDLALAAFHKKWVVQESARQAQYTREWRRRCYEEIKLAARLRYHNFKVKIGMTPPSGLHDAEGKH